jgi:hypothetical protein
MLNSTRWSVYLAKVAKLHAVARSLLGQVAQAVQDNALPLTVATLNTLLRCFGIASDLDVHALNLDELLPMLEHGYGTQPTKVNQ